MSACVSIVTSSIGGYYQEFLRFKETKFAIQKETKQNQFGIRSIDCVEIFILKHDDNFHILSYVNDENPLIIKEKSKEIVNTR